MENNDYESLDSISNLNDEALELLATKIAMQIAAIFKNIEMASSVVNTLPQHNIADESNIQQYPATVTTLEPEIDLQKDESPQECNCTCEKCKLKQIFPAVIDTSTYVDDSEENEEYYEENIDNATLYFHLLKVYEGNNIVVKRGGTQNILYVNEINEMNTGAINITLGTKDIILPLNEDGSVTFNLQVANDNKELRFKIEKITNDTEILTLAV
jgi:hypothetical protein